MLTLSGFHRNHGDRPTLMSLPFVGMGKWVAYRDSSDARSHPVVTQPIPHKPQEDQSRYEGFGYVNATLMGRYHFFW